MSLSITAYHVHTIGTFLLNSIGLKYEAIIAFINRPLKNNWMRDYMQSKEMMINLIKDQLLLWENKLDQ